MTKSPVVVALVALPLLLLATGCSSGSTPVTSRTASATLKPTPEVTGTATAKATVTPMASPSRITSPAGPATTCRTSQLSVRLVSAGAAAGTSFQSIVLTNHGSSPCDIHGYPGVAFVESAGSQVGSAASRNPNQPVTTILIQPGATVSARLGIAAYQNYPPNQCLSRPVSGLRIYPPGNTAAAYVPFTTVSAACSTKVGQLTVGPVVNGSAWQ